MPEQFCLRWDNHQSTLFSVFENLLESGTLLDCAISAEGQILGAHKVVLSACSPCFQTMLCVQEDKHPIVFLKDVKFIEIKAMIDYMYKGEVNILQDHLDSFLKVAAELKMKGLTNEGGAVEEAPAKAPEEPPEEPPAKKGPVRNTKKSDVAHKSPLVNNASLKKEGSVSPARKKQLTPKSSTAENSLDIPAPVPPPMSPRSQARNERSVEKLLDQISEEIEAFKMNIGDDDDEDDDDDDDDDEEEEEEEEEEDEDDDDDADDDDDDFTDISSDTADKPATPQGQAQRSSSPEEVSKRKTTTKEDETYKMFLAAEAAIRNKEDTYDFLYRSPKKNRTAAQIATEEKFMAAFRETTRPYDIAHRQAFKAAEALRNKTKANDVSNRQTTTNKSGTGETKMAPEAAVKNKTKSHVSTGN